MGKKVIMTIVDGLHLRYLLDAGVIDRLAVENIQMLICTIPALQSRLESLTSRYGGLVSIALLEDVPMTRKRRLYLTLVNGTNKQLSETVNFKNEITKIEEPVKHFFLQQLRKFSDSSWYKKLTKFAASSFSSAYYKKMIKEYKPDLVIFSTPGQKLHDLPLLYECISSGIGTISPVYSWDNLTAKGPFIFPVDKLVVWNEIMRQEAIVYHGYEKSHVDISGVPVFDPYVRVLNEGDEKESFRRSVGVDVEKPLITVTTVPQIFFGNCHVSMLERLEMFMDNRRIPECSILLRPHPKDMTDYSVFKNSSRIKVDTYGSSPDSSLQNWIPHEDNIVHLGRTMKYSDVVVNIGSTITIDAACFDTPVINIAYDMKTSEADYVGSVLRFYSYTHYKNVVSSKAAYIVHSDNEFISAINAYLHNPALHREERKSLVAQQTGVLDGQAHERVAQSILNMLRT
jgi:hypothetical protein